MTIVQGLHVPNFVQIHSKLWPCIRNRKQTDQTDTQIRLCVYIIYVGEESEFHFRYYRLEKPTSLFLKKNVNFN